MTNKLEPRITVMRGCSILTVVQSTRERSNRGCGHESRSWYIVPTDAKLQARPSGGYRLFDSSATSDLTTSTITTTSIPTTDISSQLHWILLVLLPTSMHFLKWPQYPRKRLLR